jgi:ABC-type Zn uptake system ZnuABC Zn-binding protein ZnuA
MIANIIKATSTANALHFRTRKHGIIKVQIARETGTKVGATLYSDALSQPGTPGASYLGMFAWNAQQIAAAMQP